MLRLYGFRHSSYYSMVKVALLEKAIPFDEVPLALEATGKLDVPPGYLDKSPMGKVPCLETQHGFLSETSVILDYLDDAMEGPSFYPAEPFGKAKVRELIKHLELYVELPARRLYGEFFGRPATANDKSQAREQLERGFDAVARLGRFAPFIAGPEITYADFFGYFALTSATRTVKAVYAWDAFNSIPGIRPLLSLMAKRESVKRVLAERPHGHAAEDRRKARAAGRRRNGAG